MRSRIFALAAVLTSTALTVAGCGSQTSGMPYAGEVDVRNLDVGKYEVAPIDSTKQYSYEYSDGKGAATVRLADHMITGLDIDPRLRYRTGFAPVIEDYDVQGIFSNTAAAAVLGNNFIYGQSYGAADMAVGSQNDAAANSTLATLAVMQFKTSDDARRAADQLEQADFENAPDKNQKIALDKYPDAHTHWQPGISTMESTISHGQYVISAITKIHGGDSNALRSMIETVYNKQLAMLDTLPSLSPLGVLELNPDPDGMIRRILNVNQVWIPDATHLAAYGLQGFLHLDQDEASQKKLYESLRIDKFGTAFSYSDGLPFYAPVGFSNLYTAAAGESTTGSNLYRSPDEAAAREVWARILNAPDPKLAPNGVPDSKCTQLATSFDVNKFTCAVRYRQYVGLVWSSQLSDTQQRAAAQYALLANSQWM